MVMRMLYLLPMMLGRTYDARSGTVGVDIFPLEELEKATDQANAHFHSSYKVVDSVSDVQNMLSISGALSLQIKAGTFAIQGSGTYIKETTKAVDSVVILAKVTYQTYTKSLRNSVRPVPGWLKFRPEDLGTHYVHSVMYGGELVASIRFKAMHHKDFQDIRANVKASLTSGSAFELVGEGLLEMLEKKLGNKASMEISYFATVPLENVPNNITGLRDLLRGFEHQIKKVNDGWGNPLEVELVELESLGSRTTFLQDRALEAELTFFETKFDDLLTAKSRLKAYVKATNFKFTDEQLNQVEDMRNRIAMTLKNFYEAIGNLNQEEGPEQLAMAYDAYEKNGKSILPGKFTRELRRFIESADTQEELLQPEGYVVYTHYGRDQCENLKGTSTISSGYVASSPANSNGTGTNYLCLPKNPELNDATGEDAFLTNSSLIAGVRFGLLKHTPLEVNDVELSFTGVDCAVCGVKNGRSVDTLYGRDECPPDREEQYRGYLMAPTTRGQHICVDKKPNFDNEIDTSPGDQTLVMASISTSFPNSTETKDGSSNFVPCVVCLKS